MIQLKNILIMMATVLPLVASAQIAFTGNDREYMEITPEANTGLKKIYVFYDVEGVGMSYTATTMNPVTWFTYDERGGGYAQEIYDVIDDPENPYLSSIQEVKGNSGYIIEEGTTRYYIWVTDYSKFPLYLSTITPENDGDCGTATIHVEGSGDDIPYYTITGVRRVLSRELKLEYDDMVWNDSNDADDDEDDDVDDDDDAVDDGDNTTGYQRKRVTDLQTGYKPIIVIPAPLCNTSFTLTGDRFMDFWGVAQTIESDTYITQAVEVHTTAWQEPRDNDNEKKSGDQGLGGSAPCHIIFSSYCTDAVVHKEWQMATDQDFKNIQLRINQNKVDETFTESGTTYWRFIGSNADGTCESYGDTYTVNVGDSELICPNVFTPGSSEGVNDIWKVSYRSLTDFHCVIFNRWGNKIIELNDPSEGWDGTYNGKLVPAGVYYYVIDAHGSDGKHYKKDGDINIIRYRRVTHGTDDSGTTVVDPDNP